jgi:hypothetical protein
MKEKSMRCCMLPLLALLAAGPSVAQNARPAAADGDALVALAQKTVVRALNYKQGSRESLMDAKDDFTAEGWSEFMKRMNGWLDDKGAPLGSQTFTPTGAAVVKSREDGVTHLSIPGTLRQIQNKSSTTYRVRVDVQLGGEPMRIEHLETIMGSGA